MTDSLLIEIIVILLPSIAIFIFGAILYYKLYIIPERTRKKTL